VDFNLPGASSFNPLVQLAPYSHTLTSLEGGGIFVVHDQILKVCWIWKVIIQSNVSLEKQKFASTHKYVKLINKVSQNRGLDLGPSLVLFEKMKS
jgi:hypothetical protein